MISYAVYKWIHLSGVLMVFMSLGAVALHTYNGGQRQHDGRKLLGITHGVGLVLSLVAGFGLLARLGVSALSGWVMVKLAIWFFFGMASMILYKKGQRNPAFWILFIILGMSAAYLAQNKPF